jgi:TRAP-type C4-dicarboxylate transport system permease small subunit
LTNSETEQLGFFSHPDSPMERRVAKFAKVLLYIGMCNVLTMMFLTVTHAVSRYAFNQPLLGVVSISSILLAMTIFAVGGYTQVVKGHIIVGILVDRLSERKRAIVDSFTYIICLVILALAFWQSILQTLILMKAGTLSGVLLLPQFVFFFIVAIGWGVFSLVMALQLRRMFSIALGRTRN